MFMQSKIANFSQFTAMSGEKEVFEILLDIYKTLHRISRKLEQFGERENHNPPKLCR
jgi:hypothetical protein